MPHRQSIVEVTLTDGQVFREHVDSVRGTVSNPMTSDEIKDKARDLMAPVLGDSTTAELINKIFAIENVIDIRQLRGLLQKTV